jgi:hypothetical protein
LTAVSIMKHFRNLVPAAEDPVDTLNKNSVETLIVAHHSIVMFWYKERLITGQRIPAYSLNDSGSGTRIRKSPRAIFRLHTYVFSSFRFFPSVILQRWELLYKSRALLTLMKRNIEEPKN